MPRKSWPTFPTTRTSSPSCRSARWWSARSRRRECRSRRRRLQRGFVVALRLLFMQRVRHLLVLFQRRERRRGELLQFAWHLRLLRGRFEQCNCLVVAFRHRLHVFTIELLALQALQLRLERLVFP